MVDHLVTRSTTTLGGIVTAPTSAVLTSSMPNPTIDGPGGPRRQDHAVVVTSDSHAGPLLKEQMRQYCPAKRLREFDEFVEQASPTGPNLPDFRQRAQADPPASGASTWDNSLTEGGWDMAARLHDMNYDGIAAEIIFHGLNFGRVEPMPFGGLFGFEPGDKDLVGLGRHMYNQWLADFVSLEPERHAGLCHLPMWDVKAAVKEMEWAREAGLRGINFPRPQPGLLPYNHTDWEPFWSAVEALEMPLTTHAQSDGGPGSFAFPGQGNLLIGILEVTGYAARRALHHLVYGGVFDRHPALKLVFTEQPGQWWGPMLNEMDSLYIMLGQLDTTLKKMPSDYGREHLFVGATCLARFEAEDAIEEGYAANVLWGSDYPHPEGSYKHPRHADEPSMSKLAMRDTFAALPTEHAVTMLGANAARVYGFDLAKLQPVADRIGAPTFEELATPLEREPEVPTVRSYAFRRHNAYH